MPEPVRNRRFPRSGGPPISRLTVFLRRGALPLGARFVLAFGASQAIGFAPSAAEMAALACPTEPPFTGACTDHQDCQNQCLVAFGPGFQGICHERDGELCCVCLATD